MYNVALCLFIDDKKFTIYLMCKFDISMLQSVISIQWTCNKKVNINLLLNY